MTKKPKLLWCGDLAAKTGFGRVSGALLPLLRGEYEIVVLASNWHGDFCPEQEMFRMYPASNRFQLDPFGIDRIREIIERENPDIVCSLNDPWLVSAQYQRIQDLHQQKKFKFCAYLTMDSYNWLGGIDPHINDWDALITFTEFGAYEFIKGGVRKPISVIPHGLDTEMFYPMDKSEARKRLGLSDDVFIVFNGNRNQPRKRIDTTISAFAKFAVDKPDTRLYLHLGLKDQGWDIIPLFGREMQKNGLDPNNRIIMTGDTPMPPNVEVDLLNAIYNTADVGINTCRGGGWELVNFEHAACRVAQVVPNHTSTKEIFEGYGKLINTEHVETDTNFCREMYNPSADHLAELLTELYEDREQLQSVADKCYERVTDQCFQWSTIAAEFHKVFSEVLAGTYDDTPKKQGSPVALEKKSKKKRGRKTLKELVSM